MKSTIVGRNAWEINTSFTLSVRAVILTSLFRQKHFWCEITSTSTEKLSSPCQNQWFDTVSTNLGTSLGSDHNNEKKPAFPHARHIYSLENYFTGGRCHLAWCVLTLADENYRGEPHEILVKCFKNFVYPWFARRKKKANSERYFKTFYSLVNLWTVL